MTKFAIESMPEPKTIRVSCENCLSHSSCSSYSRFTPSTAAIIGGELDIKTSLKPGAKGVRLIVGECQTQNSFVAADIGHIAENNNGNALKPSVVGLRVGGVATVPIYTEDLTPAPDVPLVVTDAYKHFLGE